MKAKQSLKSLENKNRIISNESVEQLPNGYSEWKNNIEQLIEILNFVRQSMLIPTP